MCSRHTLNHEEVRARVEDYFLVTRSLAHSQQAIYNKLIEFYVLFILPACNKWEEAHKAVDSSPEFDDKQKRDMSDKLIHLLQSTNELQEQKAKAAASKKNESSRKKKNQSIKSRESSNRDTSPPKQEKACPDNKPAERASQPGQFGLLSRMPNLWRTVLQASKQPAVLIRLLESFMLVLALLLALGVSENRKRIGLMVLEFLQRVRRTVLMAIRVKYV